jgi:hypothetical protein
VVVYGLGRQPEHQAAEPPLPSLLRGLTPSPEKAHGLMVVQTMHHGRMSSKYP